MGAVTEKLELMVPKTSGEQRSAAASKWDRMNRAEKQAYIKQRMQDFAPENADEDTLNKLHQHLPERSNG